MNFYNDQVEKIRQSFYPKDYLTQQIIQAKRYIDRQFANDLKTEDLCAQAFISKFHFIRLFKSLYGITPHQYLVNVRIANAKQLLKSGGSVSEICVAVGFASPTSFTALFKKITGYTPLSFKQRNFKKSNF